MKLCLILDRLRSAHNTGNIFRIAEALGAEIVACGYTPAPPHPKLAKTAMGTDLTVPCRTMPDAVSAIRMLRNEGYRMILAAEPGPESVFAWEKNYEFPLAVVFGNEALGVSEEALALCDASVSLPMFGTKVSINVGNCAAVVLYMIVAKGTEKC